MVDTKGQARNTLMSLGSAVKDSPAAARLADEAKSYVRAKGNNLLGQVGDRIESVTDHLEQGDLGSGLADGVRRIAQGDSPVKALAGSALSGVKDKVTNMFGGGGRSQGGGKVKVTNIVEDIDVGVPVRVAYNQWTEFGSFPSFMKKVESVSAESDERLNWKAQVFWSHRTWEATIREQVPDDRIVWRSKGAKGYVDGCVTFHEIGPRLTRILVVLEYHPQGLFEHTGNIWRAPGRRARLELKHFRRHVMTRTILDEESVDGWRGEIRDGEVVRTHEEALEEDEYGSDEYDGDDQDGDEDYDERDSDEQEYDEDEESEDEAPEDEDEYEYDEEEDEEEEEDAS